jgi:hypothetical protein
MEIKISAKQILKVLYILSWVIFLGLCIEAGGFLFNSVFAMYINPQAAHNFWNGIDFSSLYTFDKGHFFVLTLIMFMVATLKALMFYLIVKILHDKKLNLLQPFNKEVGRFIFNMSYLVLVIGVFSHWGAKHSNWYVKQGVTMPTVETLHFSGADVWFFMGVVLFVIAQIFKRGIEIQNENDLTI